MLCNEFDPCREAVINPADHYAPIEGFPKLCIGIFSHVIVEEMVEKYHGEVIAQIKFCTGTVPVYRLEAGGLEAALFLPHVGAASAGSFIENLVAWGGQAFCVLRLLRGAETRHCGRPSHPSYCRGAGRGAVLSLSAAVGRGGAESGLCGGGPAGNGSAGAALCGGENLDH